VSPINVVFCELEAVTKGVVNMSLSSEMQDGVDLVLVQHVRHEIRGADITLNKRVVSQILNLVKVIDAAAIIKLVVVHNIVVGVHLAKANHNLQSVGKEVSKMRSRSLLSARCPTSTCSV